MSIPHYPITFWEVAVKYPTVGAFPIMVCDSEGLSSTSSLPLRGTFEERNRFDDKTAFAMLNARRALKRLNLRRARYWTNVAQHWMDRRRVLFST